MGISLLKCTWICWQVSPVMTCTLFPTLSVTKQYLNVANWTEVTLLHVTGACFKHYQFCVPVPALSITDHLPELAYPICTCIGGPPQSQNLKGLIKMDKKLCYGKEDSASVVLSWFSSLAALFSATYGIDIPDFSNWCLSRAHRSSIGHISACWQGMSHRCLSIMPSFSVTSANIAISDTSLKLVSLGYISVAESIRVSSTNCT